MEMIPKEAIEKAIEGGWVLGNMDAARTKKDYYAYIERIALDPSFWQCLGKTLGWGTHPLAVTPNGHAVQEWIMFAHHFYDLILTGQGTKAFWDELLTTPHH